MKYFIATLWLFSMNLFAMDQRREILVKANLVLMRNDLKYAESLLMSSNCNCDNYFAIRLFIDKCLETLEETEDLIY